MAVPASVVITSDETPVPVRPRRSRVASRHRARFWVCSAIVLAYVLAAIFGPMLTHFNASLNNVTESLVPPLGHKGQSGFQLLGTDWLGRDMFEEMLQGARTSILIGATTVGIAAVVGTLVGIVAGVRGGVIDGILMRLADVQLAFPSIVMAMLIVGVLGVSILNVVLSLSLASWVVFARVARAEAVRVRALPFVDASRLLGGGTIHIMRSAVLPACVAPVGVYMTVQFAFVVVSEAALSFLGVGVPLSDASWGTTIAGGEQYLATAWWIATFPGLALAILVTCISIIGAELRREIGRESPTQTVR
ncbi:MAG TPA: ABC transporter permease [Acidimicrobiales bacterium]|jgi:peptide/nickel transport system permease protein|nr:ABC transporter permease [Acidimicrobiales bacterium]